MIRTGYLRWEIDVDDVRCDVDPRSREVIFRARPGFRTVRIKSANHSQTAEEFVGGEATYDDVLRALRRDGGGEIDVVVPDVGPRPFRYTESDRVETPRFWMAKLQREAEAFAYDVVRAAAAFPGS